MFGGRLRLGYPGQAVYDMSPHPDAKRKLAKVLSVLNKTDFGRTPLEVLRPGIDAKIIELHLTDAYSLRQIAARVGASKTYVYNVIADWHRKLEHRS
jgi:transposase-like protein